MTQFAKCPECRKDSKIELYALHRQDMFHHIKCSQCHLTFSLPEWQRQDSLLTAKEHQILGHLEDAWNEFVKLETLHPDEQTDFRHAIHEAQRNIMARPARREFKAKLNNSIIKILEDLSKYYDKNIHIPTEFREMAFDYFNDDFFYMWHKAIKEELTSAGKYIFKYKDNKLDTIIDTKAECFWSIDQGFDTI